MNLSPFPIKANSLSIDLYRKLFLIRQAEKQIIRLYPEDEMKTPMHMSLGQEAIPAAVCQALGKSGQFFSSYRSHAAFLAVTEDTDKFFAELYGRETGTAQGKAGSMHLADPERGHFLSSAIVGTGIPVAVGAAFANKRLKTGKISCVFFGDGALEEGVFWESLNVSSVMKIPLLFVCEDNGLAIHTPQSVRHGFQSLAQIVEAFGCRFYQKDSTDVEVLHDLAQQAVQATLASGKPAFLLLKCYRYLEHVGVHEDFDAGYRSKEEFEEWFQRDPVALQRRKLLNGKMSEKDLRQIENQIEQQMMQSIQRARNSPFAGKEELRKGVFYEKD